jgi:hypothetical protein
MASRKRTMGYPILRVCDTAHGHAHCEPDGSPKGDLTGEQSLQMHGEPEGEQ